MNTLTKPLDRSRLSLLIGGETLSSIGDWFTTIALSLLLFQQDESALGVGLLFTIRMLPPILFGLIGGMWADAFSKKSTLIASEVFRGTCILALFFNQSPLFSYGIIFLVAMANAFSHPALMASIKACSREEDLGRVSSLLTGSKLFAMVIGTGLAGWIGGIIGLRFLFLVDSATFFLFVLCLLPLRLDKEKGDHKEPFHLLPFLREIRKEKRLIAVLNTTVLFNFLLATWLTLQLPLFARAFSTAVEDLTLVRLVTGIGLSIGVAVAFRFPLASSFKMSAAGFICFAAALLGASLAEHGYLLVGAAVAMGFFEAIHMTGNRSHLLKMSSATNSGKMMAMRKVCESVGFIGANGVIALLTVTCEASTILLLATVAATIAFLFVQREAFGNERLTRWLLKVITNYLPVKVIKDPEGRPFLYRYHIAALTRNGPGLCIHRFCASDPDRGFHDHPWSHACSFVLAGRYEERTNPERPNERGRSVTAGHFNYVNGSRVFHRVMLEKGEDAWTIFAFGRRTKGWGFKNVSDCKVHYKPMSTQVKDLDGGWWKTAPRGRQITPVVV
jgi:MFS family permease